MPTMQEVVLGLDSRPGCAGCGRIVPLASAAFTSLAWPGWRSIESEVTGCRECLAREHWRHVLIKLGGCLGLFGLVGNPPLLVIDAVRYARALRRLRRRDIG